MGKQIFSDAVVSAFQGQRITKYFKQSDLKYFKSGQIRFGTLSQYRQEEETQGLDARGDAYDGQDRRYLHSWRGQTAQGAKQIIDRTMNTNSMNAWVFCASRGGYSQTHHSLMVNGDRSTGYQGSSVLSNACVFDLPKLIKALAVMLPSHENFDVEDGRTFIHAGNVSYNGGIQNAEDPNSLFTVPTNDEELVAMMLNKRPVFSTENEFRIILNINRRSILPESEPAMTVKSLLVSEAILGFYELS